MASAPIPPPMEAREYQRVLCERAEKEDLIICLPTGSGKTFIAISLMTSNMIRSQVNMNKKVVFVVHTVELAQQQGKSIRSLTGYEVLICTSNSTSNWTPDRWKLELNKNQVYVMIAQILYDKLLANYFGFKNIALLVIDECHNATKQHKMSEVMDLYQKYVKNNPGSGEKPRFMGLTATINKTKMTEVTDKEMAREIRALENRLGAKAVTYENLDLVKKSSTSSTIKSVAYSSAPKPGWGDPLVRMLDIRNFLTFQEVKHAVPELAKKAATSLANFSLQHVFWGHSPNVKTELNRLILDFEELFRELGPLGALCSAEHKIAKLDQLLNCKIVNQKGIDALNVKALKTQLFQFQVNVTRMVQEVQKEGRGWHSFSELISNKVEALLNHLVDYRFAANTDDALVGLIFVQRRSCAEALRQIIELSATEEPGKYGFLKPEIVTGANNVKKDALEARVSTSKQRDTIDRFRSGIVNVIICTTVLEEGIDVPSCNLVVRFNEIQAYTSFVQSMGRARKKNARFLVLTDSADGNNNLEKFKAQHDLMNRVLIGRQEEDLPADLSRMTIEDSDAIPDFAPLGCDGPKITASSATALVYQYIQKDQSREILSWYSVQKPPPDDELKVFQGHILIDGSNLFRFRDVIDGPLSDSEEMAKKAVFMEVAKILWNYGVLDQHLCPKG